jgi:hypothetical protein
MKDNKPKYTVTVRTDYVTNDLKQTQQILDRVSKIISNSYRRMQQEGCTA